MHRVSNQPIAADADFCREIGLAHLRHWRAMRAPRRAETARAFSCLLDEVRAEIQSIADRADDIRIEIIMQDWSDWLGVES